MPELSVVVVNYNTRDATAACLRSVLQTAATVDLELIVVDNGSTDGSVPAFRSRFPGVVTIEAGAERIRAKGVRLGHCVDDAAGDGGGVECAITSHPTRRRHGPAGWIGSIAIPLVAAAIGAFIGAQVGRARVRPGAVR